MFSFNTFFRIFVVLLGLLIGGLNDATPGALLPFIENFYQINRSLSSLFFFTPFIGYTLSALSCSYITSKIGLWGISILAPACMLIAYTVLSLGPPLPIALFIFIFQGFGLGSIDAAWNSWIGSLPHSNEILGIVHGTYGIGAFLTPIIAIRSVNNGSQWNDYYFFLACFTIFLIILSTIAFFGETPTKVTKNLNSLNNINQQQDNISINQNNYNDIDKSDSPATTSEALKFKYTYIFAAFILFYFGVEVSLGGYLETYVLETHLDYSKINNFNNSSSFDPSNSYISTALAGGVASTYWIGLAIGRLTLGFITGRGKGERANVLLYIYLFISIQFLTGVLPVILKIFFPKIIYTFIWQQPLWLNYITAFLEGALIGPYFPTAMVLITKLLPPRMHVACIGVASAIGASGGSLLPFFTGLTASHFGASSLHVVVFLYMIGVYVLWSKIPKSYAQFESNYIPLTDSNTNTPEDSREDLSSEYSNKDV